MEKQLPTMRNIISKCAYTTAGVLCITVFLSHVGKVFPVLCNIGYGQRGLRHQSEIMWQRNCKGTTYCFEAVTGNIEKVKPLIDYPWVRFSPVTLTDHALTDSSSSGLFQNSYYREFYIKGCGGAYGMPLDFHPWQDIEGANEDVVGSVKVNLTFPATITTQGGTTEFDLRYTCRRDLCSGKCLVVSWL